MADLKDLIKTLKNEGLLTRNKGTNSIKSVKVMFGPVLDQLSNAAQATVDSLKDQLLQTDKIERDRISRETQALRAQEDLLRESANRGTGAGTKTESEKTVFGGLGMGLGKLGAGLLSSAAGLAAMGVAISAFFAGLVLGDATLGWMKKIGLDFDFKNLKNAALGFSEVIKALDPDAMIALGAILGASTISGTKGAKGLGAMGVAISAFFAGLVLGDATLGWLKKIGLDFDFKNLKNAIKGFSSIIEEIDEPTLVALGAILGSSVILSLKGDPIGPFKALAAMGAGIVAFFAAIAVGSKGLDWINSDFEGIANACKGFSNAIKNLDGPAMATLAVLLGAGGLLGAVTNEKTKAKMVTGIGALSAGIIAFFAGFATIDAAARNIGEGDSAKNLIKNFSESIMALDDRALKVLGVIMGAGALAGMFGIGIAAGAAAGIGLFGTAIAAFFLAFAGLDAVTEFIGSDGSSLKAMMVNMSDGIKALADIDGTKLANVVGPLAKLGPAMALFLGSEGLGKLAKEVADFATEVVTEFKSFVFDDVGDGKKKNIFETIVELLEPIKKFDMEHLKKIDIFAEAFLNLSKSLEKFQDLNWRKINRRFIEMGESLSKYLPIFDRIWHGGEFESINFGTGLKNVPVDDVYDSVRKMNAIFSFEGPDVATVAANMQAASLAVAEAQRIMAPIIAPSDNSQNIQNTVVNNRNISAGPPPSPRKSIMTGGMYAMHCIHTK